MAKHTKETWHVLITEERGVTKYALKNTMGAESDEEAQANARLIEAAPILLEGLKDLFRLLDEGKLVRDISNDHDPNWALNAADLVARLAKAKLAVADAEGEE